MGPDFGGFDTTFQLMQGLFVVVFIIVVGGFVVTFARGLQQRARDNAAPEVAASARVVDKRAEVSGGGTTHHAGLPDANGMIGPPRVSSSPISRTDYVTFEQSSGARFELQVPEHEYGLLVVGDSGTVTMKGSRYLGFQREILR